MNDVTNRFVRTYKEMRLTGYRMGKDCPSITKQKISNIENGITEVTAEILADFLSAYEKVNANYILTGRGKMFISDSEEPAQDVTKGTEDAVFKLFEKIFSELSGIKAQNAEMSSELFALKNEVKNKKIA